jgi:hypothetical protein
MLALDGDSGRFVALDKFPHSRAMRGQPLALAG